MSNNQQNQQTQQKPPQPQPTALAAVSTAPDVMALVPTTLDGAMQFSRWLAQSSLLPKSINKEHDIFFIVCAGLELGLPPMASLRGLYVVHGRTALESKTKAALCLQKKAARYFKRTEYTNLATTWETWREGQVEPVKFRYTLQEAQEAGLAPDRSRNFAGKEGPWRQYTQRMISHRALGWLCDDVYPDIVMGVATAEDFDPQEFTFKPIGASAELGTPNPAPAAVATEVISGVPANAKPANDTSGGRPRVPTDDPKAEVGNFARDTTKQGDGSKAGDKAEGPPLVDEDEIVDIVERMSKIDTEKNLKAFSKSVIQPRKMDDRVRQRLLDAYNGQMDMILDAANRDKKEG